MATTKATNRTSSLTLTDKDGEEYRILEGGEHRAKRFRCVKLNFTDWYLSHDISIMFEILMLCLVGDNGIQWMKIKGDNRATREYLEKNEWGQTFCGENWVENGIDREQIIPF